MLGAFQIMFNGLWAILSISLPLSDFISFTIWQYFVTLFLIIVIIRNIFSRSQGGES